MSKINIAIVMPVYNDWTSFRLLVLDLAKALSGSNCSVEIIAVDDCSSESAPEEIVAKSPIEKITTLELRGNMGHQRAIAIGLMAISDRPDIDYVVVREESCFQAGLN
ncbi:MAG TPA: glycosyltransferase [Aestuariivirgaceae bacterium]|nr:glycosyltransferase [Aestuariivirgaceae bacterium]